MNSKTSEALRLIEKIKKPDDSIFEIIRTEKRTGWLHFWDFVSDIFFDIMPFTSPKSLYDKNNVFTRFRKQRANH